MAEILKNKFRVWDGKRMTECINKKQKLLLCSNVKSTKGGYVFEGDIVYVKHKHEVKSLETESWYEVVVNKKEKRFQELILEHRKGENVGCRFEKIWKYDVVGNVYKTPNYFRK